MNTKIEQSFESKNKSLKTSYKKGIKKIISNNGKII